jgi:hypothetical protein
MVEILNNLLSLVSVDEKLHATLVTDAQLLSKKDY